MTNETERPMGRVYLDTKSAADYLCMSARTLKRWRQECRGPRYVSLGRRIIYRAKDLDDWVSKMGRLRR